MDNKNTHDQTNNQSWQGGSQPSRYSQTVGERGPILEQDTMLHEKNETFIHETILERPLHVKGFGAFGYFETFNSMAAYTKLCFLQRLGQQVPVAVRFSLAASNRGTPDTSRNVRGFSTKFYTEQGIFDLICNHLPVFTVRDPMRFVETVSAFNPSPVNNLMDPNRFWSFYAKNPEATHFVLQLYSDLGTIKSLRHIPGYSVSTYVWKNEQGVRTYVKYNWIPLAGVQYIDSQEAARLACENPDYAGKDLYDTIAQGVPVEYGLYVQLMNPQDEATLPFDPLDDTKVWDAQQYPLLPVGKMVLNRNPDNYKEQVEKLAFSPSNMLEGAEFSLDRVLQGRANIYTDSQRYRLGPNFRSIPINHQANWKPSDEVTSSTGSYVAGRLERTAPPKGDDFTQPGQFYNSLSPVLQEHLVRNIASDLGAASSELQQIVLGYLAQANQELGERVAWQIGNKEKE
ncbi:catalase [Lysinibacillus sp. FSL H8-0500]|uniref:catalase n=1 Tax=Lysinibacillus sp. FSL H8-0500 TaxID=2921393 RepID=UPI0031018E81